MKEPGTIFKTINGVTYVVAYDDGGHSIGYDAMMGLREEGHIAYRHPDSPAVKDGATPLWSWLKNAPDPQICGGFKSFDEAWESFERVLFS